MEAMISCLKNRKVYEIAYNGLGTSRICVVILDLLASCALSRCWSATARSLWLRLERGISIELLALSKVHFGSARGCYQENAY